jgi:hypothetical protein
VLVSKGCEKFGNIRQKMEDAMTMNIEERLQNLEDIVEITRLKARYCDAVDCGWDRPLNDANGVASLFTPDGVWEAGKYGRAEGREAIRELFKTSLYPFAFHRISNPSVKVDGDTATGKWHILVAHIIEGQSVWVGGVYNDRFVRTEEGWRFKELNVTIAFTGEQNWQVEK